MARTAAALTAGLGAVRTRVRREASLRAPLRVVSSAEATHRDIALSNATVALSDDELAVARAILDGETVEEHFGATHPVASST